MSNHNSGNKPRVILQNHQTYVTKSHLSCNFASHLRATH